MIIKPTLKLHILQLYEILINHFSQLMQNESLNLKQFLGSDIQRSELMDQIKKIIPEAELNHVKSVELTIRFYTDLANVVSYVQRLRKNFTNLNRDTSSDLRACFEPEFLMEIDSACSLSVGKSDLQLFKLLNRPEFSAGFIQLIKKMNKYTSDMANMKTNSGIWISNFLIESAFTNLTETKEHRRSYFSPNRVVSDTGEIDLLTPVMYTPTPVDEGYDWSAFDSLVSTYYEKSAVLNTRYVELSECQRHIQMENTPDQYAVLVCDLKKIEEAVGSVEPVIELLGDLLHESSTVSLVLQDLENKISHDSSKTRLMESENLDSSTFAIDLLISRGLVMNRIHQNSCIITKKSLELIKVEQESNRDHVHTSTCAGTHHDLSAWQILLNLPLSGYFDRIILRNGSQTLRKEVENTGLGVHLSENSTQLRCESNSDLLLNRSFETYTGINMVFFDSSTDLVQLLD